LQQIQAEIAALPDDQLRQLSSWFDDFYAQRWDREILSDGAHGKLDDLAAEALVEYHTGKTKPL